MIAQAAAAAAAAEAAAVVNKFSNTGHLLGGPVQNTHTTSQYADEFGVYSTALRGLTYWSQADPGLSRSAPRSMYYLDRLMIVPCTLMYDVHAMMYVTAQSSIVVWGRMHRW